MCSSVTKCGSFLLRLMEGVSERVCSRVARHGASLNNAITDQSRCDRDMHATTSPDSTTNIPGSNVVPAAPEFSSPHWSLGPNVQGSIRKCRILGPRACFLQKLCMPDSPKRFQPRYRREHPRGSITLRCSCQPPPPTEHFWRPHAV